MITIGAKGDWNCTNVGDPYLHHFKLKIGSVGGNDTADRVKLHTICYKNATMMESGNPLSDGLSGSRTFATILALTGAFVVSVVFVYLLVANHQRIKNAYTNFTV